ncbi:MAG: DUF6491 family protein [Oceanicaulis sp.]
MLRKISILSAALFFLSACAAGMDAEMTPAAAERLAAFTMTGEADNCLSLRRIDDITPLDDRFWLVETTSGAFYLNEVSAGCNGAASGFTFLQYDTPTGQLCDGEIVRVYDNNADILRGSCALGEYQRLVPNR